MKPIGKNLSDIFPIKNVMKVGGTLSLLLFNFALEHAIKKFQVHEDDIKLNNTHQLLVYDDDCIHWAEEYVL
jgi:hypothetical protein